MTRDKYRAALARARANGHAVKFGGSAHAGYWWECECGAGDQWVVFADPFDRTFDAHTHMLDALVKRIDRDELAAAIYTASCHAHMPLPCQHRPRPLGCSHVANETEAHRLHPRSRQGGTNSPHPTK